MSTVEFKKRWSSAGTLLLEDAALKVVVTGHLMPGMTVGKLASAIRRALPPVPALLVSSYTHVDDGALDLPRLAKPFRQDDLKRALPGLTHA